MGIRLIDDWRQAYKFASMWAMSAAVALQGAWQMLPPDLKGALPDGLVTWASVALVVLGMVGRLVHQGGGDARKD